MAEYAEYDKLITESCQLLTLARYIRGSKLAVKSHEHVVVVTQYGLKKGDKEATLVERRRVMVESQYDTKTGVVNTDKPVSDKPKGEASERDASEATRS